MPDAQGQTYWQWARALDFAPRTADADWDPARHSLSLASRLGSAPASVAPAQTRTAANRPPMAVDAYGTWARVEARAAGDRILAGGVTEPEQEILTMPAGAPVRDMAPTPEGWLLIALSTGVVILHDLLDRFADVELTELGFVPDRIAVTGTGASWLLDRGARALRRLRGTPLPERVARRARADHVFQPVPLEQDPPRFETPLVATLNAGEEVIDATALPDGRLAILLLAPGRRSVLRVTDGTTLSEAMSLAPLQSAFSLACFGADKLAFAVPGADTAVAVPMPPSDLPDLLPPLGLALPLRRGLGRRFCKSVPGGPLAYVTTPTQGPRDTLARPFARLVAPSRPVYARFARVAARMVEGDEGRTIWHRLYLEGHFPPGCGATLLLAADDDGGALAALPPTAMHPHRFGATPDHEGPTAVWLDMDSELPFLPSAVGEARKVDRCGLFSVLVQKSGETVRRIRGRHLRVEILLHGTGSAAPHIHALRVWGGRRSWRERYLPHFLSVEEGPLAAGSDFLDRYLAIFEGVLTPLEDQVAASWRLTRPQTAPADALDWLAGWIGAELDPVLSEAAKRRLLANAVSLWRRRGTLSGLKRVLDIVTEGGVTQGRLVVLEHYHLRRTFVTILGADLSDADNPLTPHASMSGNSHLGATFFLGAEDQKAFFALFRPELLGDPLTSEEERLAAREALASFFDDHAHRVTVLVHETMDRTMRDLVARVLEREVPAHVQATLASGPGTLVLALSSLLSVDTWIGPPPPRGEVTLGEGRIGQIFLSDTPSLDPRLEGGA